MYKRIKTKIDGMDGTSCRRVDSIYQILSKYENGNTTIDTVIDKLWTLFLTSEDDIIGDYKKDATEIFTEMLKYFTKNKKGLFESYLSFEDHDIEIVEGYICNANMESYMMYDDLQLSLSIYRLYQYFRNKKCR
jgi:hypothetical protein